jgi:hypothetical protein
MQYFEVHLTIEPNSSFFNNNMTVTYDPTQCPRMELNQGSVQEFVFPGVEMVVNFTNQSNQSVNDTDEEIG